MKIKLLIVTLLVASTNLLAQSKKEQIATLSNRLNNLRQKYTKDTTYLSNTVETMNREYTILSMQYDEAQEDIKKKSATISDNTEKIRSLSQKNEELSQINTAIKEENKALDELNRQLKERAVSLDRNIMNRVIPRPEEDDWSGWDMGNAYSDFWFQSMRDDYGNIKWIQERCGGKRNGFVKHWYSNGQLKYIGLFDDGVPIVEKCFDENGQQKLTQPCTYRGQGH